jgi:uncharacterized protein (DUF608 family)
MSTELNNDSSMPRRAFFKLSAATMGAIGSLGASSVCEAALGETDPTPGDEASGAQTRRAHGSYQGEYAGEYLNQVAFPLGGLGAGMICLEGTGALSHFSLHHRPEIFNEPCVFAAVSIKGPRPLARVLEGPVPGRKLFGPPDTARGASGKTYGLPRFSKATFKSRFPFGTVELADKQLPLKVELAGWSPFEPGDPDNSGLPVAALEYRFTNTGPDPVDAVFSFNAKNFMGSNKSPQAVQPTAGGFVLWGGGPKDESWEEGAFSATVSDPQVKVNHAWFRGAWWDALTMAWEDVAAGACYDRAPLTGGDPSPGATLFVPFQLAPRASKTIALRLAWYVGQSNLRVGKDPAGLAVAPPPSPDYYRPWYANRFAGIDEVTAYWRDHYEELRQNSRRFSDCFYDSTLPPEITHAVAANLVILKSPTILRQADGRLWAWEGSGDTTGWCPGSCTHVWNYAQAMSHLFPSLERTLRETEFGPNQDEHGHQEFRGSLPIRPVVHDNPAAADGQLGGIMKTFREWRISGDSGWLRTLWPKVKRSLDYCIETWDPGHKGVLEEPHHNTYDIEFWGPDGMCTSFYLGALRAAMAMGQALGEETPLYAQLLESGTRAVETDLFNGEYFIQHIKWKELRAPSPLKGKNLSPETIALTEKEGPRYQYGGGCLADGVVGAWLALVCGLGQVMAPAKVASHLRAVYGYNLKPDLSDFANPQRPTFACGAEGGLLLCTWPNGGELSLPFPYSKEVWTGIEYQVASHLLRMGQVDEGLEVVRTCRDRYDGRIRNPFDEYEYGHWYGRALASYALLFGMSGARYDAIDRILYLDPAIGGDFRCFFSTATSYGTVGVKDGKPFYEPKSGELQITEIKYAAKV